MSFTITGEKRIRKTLQGFTDEALKRKILLSVLRQEAKPIIEDAKQNANSIDADPIFVEHIKSAIAFKASKKSKFTKTGLVSGSVYPIPRKMPKQYRHLGHLFNTGTRKGIDASLFMAKAESKRGKSFEGIEKNINKSLARYAKKNGFQVR